MRRLTPFFVLVFLVLCAALPAALRWMQYHDVQTALDINNWTQPDPTRAVPDYTVAGIPLVVTPTSRQFTDQPTELGGVVLLDQSHDNNFELDELDYLRSRLAARGTELRLFTNGDLGGALREAQSLVVIVPLTAYSEEEHTAVREFVERGGRLLLIGDPARFQVDVVDEGFSFEIVFNTADLPLNQLATEFDLTFRGDYLYNTNDNEGNYANIIIGEEGLAEDTLTNNLTQVALYGSNSLQLGASGKPLLTADEQTFSSDTNRANNAVLAATSMDGRVMAIGDINFLTAPYYSTFDNGRFITNMADFLAAHGREYILTDLPYLYQQPIDLLYVGDVELGAEAFDQIITLQQAWQTVGKSLQLASAPQAGHDALYLGLYNQTLDTDLEAWLAERGIELLIDPPILTAVQERELALQATPIPPTATPDPDAPTPVPSPTPLPPPPADRLILAEELGQIKMAGTTLILFDEAEDGTRTVVVLAASQEGLDNSVERLAALAPTATDYNLADCLLAETYALCPSGVDDEAVEAELITGPVELVDATDETDETDTAVDTSDEDIADEDTEEDVEDASDEEDDTPTGPTLDDLLLPYEIVGTLTLGEEVSEELPAATLHGWELEVGPAMVDISASGEEAFDMVLEVYNPDGVRVAQADDNFNSDPETIAAFELDEGVYTIIVADYYDEGGTYTLSVVESDASESETEEATEDEDTQETEETEETEESDASLPQLFIYLDDNDELVYTALAEFIDYTAVFSDAYDLTFWSANDDGNLSEDDLVGYDLIIWDSGGYRNEDGGAEDDSFILLGQTFQGGNLLVTGLVPPLLEPTELGELVNVEVVTDDEEIPLGFAPGEVLELLDVYDTAVLDLAASEDEGQTFLLRGPDSELPGDVVGSLFAEEQGGAKTGILALPLQALESDDQEVLLNALVDWFLLDDTAVDEE